jgi:hypothetical protein
MDITKSINLLETACTEIVIFSRLDSIAAALPDQGFEKSQFLYEDAKIKSSTFRFVVPGRGTDNGAKWVPRQDYKISSL